MRTTKTIPILALTVVSLVAGFALVNVQAANAGDPRSQRSMTDPRAAGGTMNFGKQAVTNPPPEKANLPPRPPGLQSGDQIQLTYDARTKSYGFGHIQEIRKAGEAPVLPTTTTTTTHDHRGKTASKPPSLPPGSPPPAAPAAVGPPAAPPGTVSTPSANGNEVRDHTYLRPGSDPAATGYGITHDHREGYDHKPYEVRSFTTATGGSVTITPRQKPPCYGNTCWLTQ